MDSPGPKASSVIGRYSIYAEIAHGGMATVHVGRLMGPVGFSRTVAIKRLHSMYAKDPEFVAMFMDEARLAARIQHNNVVSIIDVVAEKGELILVMDYVQGESLSRLMRAEREQGRRIEPGIAAKIMTEVLSGLHAAHEAKNERGVALGVVHRDVSPQNILVGVDGVAHLIDFGIAKAAGRIQSTREGQVKGKLAYMAPEQIRIGSVDRRTDVYASAAVLWELLAGERLFKGEDANLMYSVLTAPIQKPSALVADLSASLDAVVMKGLERDPEKRYSTALEMADALESATRPASSRDVARWMERLAAKALEHRANVVAEVESVSHASVLPPRPVFGDLDAVASIPSADASPSPQPIHVEFAPPPIKEIAPAELLTLTSSTVSSARLVASMRPHPRRWLLIAAAVVLLPALIWLTTKVVSAPSPKTATFPQASLSIDHPLPPLPSQSSSSPALSIPPTTSTVTATLSASSSATPPRPGKQPPLPVNTSPMPKKKPTYTRD